MEKEKNGIANVPVEVAKEMVKAYAEDGITATKCYTKAVWFSADQILKIAEKITDGTHDGLRIYFAQYVEGGLEDLPEHHIGRNTVLLVPTLASIGNGDEHPDDTADISNRGQMCPDRCDGVAL